MHDLKINKQLWLPMRLRILNLIKNRSKLGLKTDSLTLYEIINEDTPISRYTVYYHLNSLENDLEIISEIVRKKEAYLKPTKFYFINFVKNNENI